MNTHRCPGSLKQQVSIRHDLKYGFLGIDGDMPVWNLRTLEEDPDWDTTYLRWCCTINYCPFCGKKLE